MYENIYGISILGDCFSTKTVLPLYKDGKKQSRVSLIFGKNGSGKSTIAKAFSLYKSDCYEKSIKCDLLDRDNNLIKMSSTAKKDIYVFDESFISENINIKEDGLSTIVLLGKQGDIQAQIDTTSDQIKALKLNADTLKTKSAEYDDKKNGKSPDYFYQKIKALLGEKDGWADKDSKIKKNGEFSRKSNINPEVVDFIGLLKVTESLSDLEKLFTDNSNLLLSTKEITANFPDKISQLVLPSDAEDKYLNLLSKKIQKPEFTDREKEIFQVIESSSHVMDSKKYFITEDNKICPFCFRPIDAAYKNILLDRINRVLNKEVERHQGELHSVQLPDFIFDESKYIVLDKQQNLSVVIAVKAYNDIIHMYNKLCDQKANQPFTPIESKKLGLLDAMQKVNAEIEKLNQIREKYNKAIKDKESLKEQLEKINYKIAHLQINELYQNYLKQSKEKETINQELKDAQSDLIEAEKHLDTLNQQRKSVNIAAEKINQSLEYIFMSKDRLKLIPTADKYELSVKGASVKPEQVSCGERI